MRLRDELTTLRQTAPMTFGVNGTNVCQLVRLTNADTVYHTYVEHKQTNTRTFGLRTHAAECEFFAIRCAWE